MKKKKKDKPEGKEQHRPRLSPDENLTILALRAGWKPSDGPIPSAFTQFTSESPAKVLILDIETAPIKGYFWNLWKQNIGTGQIICDWFMLTWSAKWLFEKEVFSDKLTSKEAKNGNDKRISKSIWELVDEADIIIAHNGLNFDIKRLNSRWIINGFDPPMPFQIIDTLLHARKRFGFSSNKLDYINKLLGIKQKMDTGGFSLWERCMEGDVQALRDMEKYNIQDVKILEQTYLMMRAWIKPHPNMGLFIEDDVSLCPSCGSEDLVVHKKHYATSASRFHLFRCKECKSTGRSRKAIKNKSQTRPMPR